MQQSTPRALNEVLRSRGEAAGLIGVILAVARAGSGIAATLRRARLEPGAPVVGALERRNVQGEQQQQLDVIADELLLSALEACPAARAYASEEREQAVALRDDGDYLLLADPLDGSSNIDVAAPVGTIFSVLPAPAPAALLQPGRRQRAAGYVLYGSSLLLVLATGAGVDLYVYDFERDDYLLAESQLAVPARHKLYSLNEAYHNDFEAGIARYLDFAHGAGYSARYVGSMVADVHRTLLKGGVFLYPATRRAPQGKLRLLYEANPMAFVMEQAGGAASTGPGGPILDVTPHALHQRTPVILGSTAEVEQVLTHLG